MPIPQLSSFAIFASLAVTINYLLVISWFPAVLLAYEKHCGGTCCCMGCERTVCCAKSVGAGEAPPPRRVVTLMKDKFAPGLYKLRFFDLMEPALKFHLFGLKITVPSPLRFAGGVDLVRCVPFLCS